jgi:hypothetical protein
VCVEKYDLPFAVHIVSIASIRQTVKWYFVVKKPQKSQPKEKGLVSPLL